MKRAPTSLRIREMLAAFRHRTLSPVEVAIEFLAAIEIHNPELKAYTAVPVEDVVASAREAELRYMSGNPRPLEGILVAVKDMIDTKGLVTSYGSLTSAGNLPLRDAAIVARLRKQGGIVLGKTATHEFAWGVMTNSRATGAVKNPHDLSRSPGGSSGGSAAVVAARLAPVSIGTDTGGSVRIPAALCGVVGFKPTRAALPLDGVFPFSPSLDHVGLIGGCVDDVVLLANTLSSRSRKRFRAASKLGSQKVAVTESLACVQQLPEVSVVWRDAICALAATGADLALVEDLLQLQFFDAFATIVLMEAGSFHARFRSPAIRARDYDPETLERLKIAGSKTLADYDQALSLARDATEAVDALFGHHDILLTPTCPCPAPSIGATEMLTSNKPISIRSALMAYTALFNVTGHPACSIPCGITPDGLPVGLQIVGRRDADGDVLEFAKQTEKILAAVR